MKAKFGWYFKNSLFFQMQTLSHLMERPSTFSGLQQSRGTKTNTNSNALQSDTSWRQFQVNMGETGTVSNLLARTLQFISVFVFCNYTSEDGDRNLCHSVWCFGHWGLKSRPGSEDIMWPVKNRNRLQHICAHLKHTPPMTAHVPRKSEAREVLAGNAAMDCPHIIHLLPP